MKPARIGWWSAVVIAPIVLAGCSSPDPQYVIEIAPDSYVPAPPPVHGAPPSPADLSALFNAARDFAVRPEDRARLFDGPVEQNIRLVEELAVASLGGSEEYVFTRVTDFDGDTLSAVGHRRQLAGVPPGPDDTSIPFTRAGDEWKVSRVWACNMIGGC